MEMTTVKTVAVFAIIFGCFAVLYPKIFHPMLLHLLGMAPSRRSADDMSKNHVSFCSNVIVTLTLAVDNSILGSSN